MQSTSNAGREPDPQCTATSSILSAGLSRMVWAQYSASAATTLRVAKTPQEPYVRANVRLIVRDAAAIWRRNRPANLVFCVFEERCYRSTFTTAPTLFELLALIHRLFPSGLTDCGRSGSATEVPLVRAVRCFSLQVPITRWMACSARWRRLLLSWLKTMSIKANNLEVLAMQSCSGLGSKLICQFHPLALASRQTGN
jgi:hypothetical protein